MQASERYYYDKLETDATAALPAGLRLRSRKRRRRANSLD